MSSQPDQIACRPFVKWAGGKGSVVGELVRRVPGRYGTYFEPFVGGGALFFALQPKRAVLSDSNADLIVAYKMVQQRVDDLIDDLSRHRHTKTYYYRIRNADRQGDYWVWSDVEKASRLIYLNKTCFNGLYRVNSRGEFNVPFGEYKNPKIVDARNLHACSKALRGVTIKAGPYEKALKEAVKGDFVYLDPPFVPLSKTASFTAYNKEGFGEEDQKRLGDVCRSLDAKGVKFLLSNSCVPFVLELYNGFCIECVKAPRAINSRASGRGKIDEVLVRNYS